MNRPPSVVRLRIRNPKRRHNICLWIPVFPILLFVIPFALMLAPFVLLAAVVLWYTGIGRSILLLGPALYGLICALRGFEIDVKKGSEQIYISFR